MKIDLVFLLKAIKDNENIYIYHKTKKETLRYLSRFFRVDTTEKNETISIDLPYVEGYTHKQLVEKDVLSVYFHSAGFRFHFLSSVLESCFFTMQDGTRIPYMKISWPTEILDGNRRSLYRLAVHLERNISVKYHILGNIKCEKPFEGAEQVEYGGVEAMMIDISENGVALRINRPMNIETDDKLKLRFQLEARHGRVLFSPSHSSAKKPGIGVPYMPVENSSSLEGNEPEDIEIEGVVRNIRCFPNSQVHICGIEFTDEKTTTYKQALRRISCYIMAHNREDLHFFTVNHTVSKNPFIQKIVENEITEEFLHLLVLKKLPLTDEEYLEGLVYVLKITAFREKARELLELLPMEVKEDYIQRFDANHRVAYYLLEEAVKKDHLEIIARTVRNPYLPVEFLSHLAEHGSEPMHRILMANTVKLVAYPELMDIIEESPNATPTLLEKIREIRSGYLDMTQPESIPEAEVLEGVGDMVTAETKEPSDDMVPMETREIIERAKKNLRKINRMSLSKRLRLALTGEKPERMILAKDPNPLVVEAVLESPNLSEEEAVFIAQNKKLPKEVVDKMCGNKNVIKHYAAVLSLLKHPEVPSIKVTALLGKLHPHDVQKLTEDTTISSVVRNLAKYYLEENEGKKVRR